MKSPPPIVNAQTRSRASVVVDVAPSDVALRRAPAMASDSADPAERRERIG
jgi:hypothetical protein